MELDRPPWVIHRLFPTPQILIGSQAPHDHPSPKELTQKPELIVAPLIHRRTLPAARVHSHLAVAACLKMNSTRVTWYADQMQSFGGAVICGLAERERLSIVIIIHPPSCSSYRYIG